MFRTWTKENTQKTKDGALSPKSSPNVRDGIGVEDQEKSLEALARVLRILGRHAFELEQRTEEDIEKEFEHWALHVLMGQSVREEDSEDSQATIRRDWGELAKFVNTHRQTEKHYVTRNLQDVRNVLWEFTHTVGRAIVEDQESDQKVENYLGQLRAATECGSFNDVKQALFGVVQGIHSVLQERKQRQQHRIQKLGEKLRTVEQELGSTKKKISLDPLTQLHNRGALDLQLERTASVSFFSESAACLLMVDIDHFKHINDTYGHPAGDVVLQQLADRLVSTFPRKTDFIARYGGEEFCVLLQGAGIELCQRLGERLLKAVRDQPFSYKDFLIPATVSVGAAQLLPGETVPTWVERADRALYRAKDNGRDQVCLAQDVPVTANQI